MAAGTLTDMLLLSIEVIERRPLKTSIPHPYAKRQSKWAVRPNRVLNQTCSLMKGV